MAKTSFCHIFSGGPNKSLHSISIHSVWESCHGICCIPEQGGIEYPLNFRVLYMQAIASMYKHVIFSWHY